jgi:hypothetical protein
MESIQKADVGYPPVELAGTYADAPTSGGGTRPQSQVEQRAITVVRCCAKSYCAPVLTFPSPCLFPGIVSRRQWTNISGMFRASVPTSGGLVAWTDSTPCRPTVALRDVVWEKVGHPSIGVEALEAVVGRKDCIRGWEDR